MNDERWRIYQREWMQRRRAAWLSQGLTTNGTIRKPRLPQDAPRAANGQLREVKQAADRAHYRQNRERIGAVAAAYRAAHPEENRRRVAAWTAAHPDRAASSKARRCANRKFGEAVPSEEWDAVWAGSCFACGLTPARGVDHVIPKVRGGRNVVDNLQPACWPCNREKARGEVRP